MDIPKEYSLGNEVFKRKMESWACKSLKRHGFSCNDAPDIVQETYDKIDKASEPYEPIRSWISFLRSQLGFRLLEYSNREKRKKPAPPVSLEDGRGESRTLAETLVDSRLNPEETLLRIEQEEQEEREEQRWRNRLDRLPYVVGLAILTLASEGKFTGSGRVECFEEVVMRHISNASVPFDTHRRAVEAECEGTPPKSTAAKWWKMVRVKIPEIYEILETEAEGGYVA